MFPIEYNRAAAASFIRYHGGMGTRERTTRRLGYLIARMGLLSLVANDQRAVDIGDQGDPNSLSSLLTNATGESQLCLAVTFGPTRSNQKPIIRAIRKDGTTVAYAKVGWNDLTKGLITNEVGALQNPAIKDLRQVVTPAVLHIGPWGSNLIAVFEALEGRPGRLTPPSAAFEEVGRMWPTETTNLSNSRYATRLREQSMAVQGSAAATTKEVIGLVLERYGDHEFEFGGGHGDWTPWNNARRDGGKVVLWDWERAGHPGIIGFDSINYRFQPLAVKGRRSLSELLRAGTEGIEALSPPQRIALGHLYAATIALRHLQPGSERGLASTSLGYLEELRLLVGGAI